MTNLKARKSVIGILSVIACVCVMLAATFMLFPSGTSTVSADPDNVVKMTGVKTINVSTGDDTVREWKITDLPSADKDTSSGMVRWDGETLTLDNVRYYPVADPLCYDDYGYRMPLISLAAYNGKNAYISVRGECEIVTYGTAIEANTGNGVLYFLGENAKQG